MATAESQTGCLSARHVLLAALAMVVAAIAYGCADSTAVANSPNGPAAEADVATWEATAKALESAQVPEDCGRIWDLLWPWAAKGHAEASYTLAELIAWQHLTPEGGGEDALARLRLSMGLFKSAAQAGNSRAQETLADFYAGELYGKVADRQLAECWRAVRNDGSDVSQCKVLDDQQALLPLLETLVSEMERLPREGRGARCLAPAGDTVGE